MRTLLWALMMALLFPLAWASPVCAKAAKARTATQGARLGSHPDLTRLVLDVSEPAEFRTLVTDKGRRILVGFASVDWEANRHQLKPFGLIARYDFMRRGVKRGLLVIRTTRPARIERKFALPPDKAAHKGHRLVLDLVAAGHPGRVPAPR